MNVSKRWQSLVLRSMWIRKSRFFRWAHKPLCQQYHREVIHLGRYHFCRSCTLLWTGLLLGTVVSIFFLEHSNALLPGVTGVVTICGFVSLPVIYRRFSRIARDVIRFATGLFISSGLVFTWVSSWEFGLFSIAFIWGMRQIILRQRANANNDATCQNCPEYQTGKICSGFEQQSQSAREFEILASSYVTKNCQEGR